MKYIHTGFVLLLMLLAACYKEPDTVYDNYVSQERIIKSFDVGAQQVGDAVISLRGDSATVTVSVKNGTDLSSITPTIVVSPEATISPASGEPVDFAAHDNKYTYVVTSASGIQMKWTVFIRYNNGLKLIPNTGDWDPDVKVYSDSLYNAYLTRYKGWNGGDGCTSLLLPNGDILWTFQDSFIGEIDDDRSRDPAKNTFVRNAAFIQKNGALNSHELLNPADGGPKTWITVPGAVDGDKDLYWEGYAQIVDGKVQLLMGHMHLEDGVLAHQATDVAVFSLPGMKLEKIVSSDPMPENLALHKNAYASSTHTGDVGSPDAVTDGELATRWGSNYTDDEWIYVDLGQSSTIDSVVLVWENAYAASYKIQVSEDAQNWADVYTNTDGHGGTEQITFTPVEARYVRMLGLKQAQLAFGTFGYSLYQFAIYNSSKEKGDARLYVGELAFESGFYAADGYTYIYASEGYGICASHLYVARVANHDLTGQWEFYTKDGWVQEAPADHSEFVDICNANVTQPNVFEEDGKYYLVSQATCYGLNINIWESNSPTGPFINSRTIYKIPEKYSQDSPELPHFISYNAFVHHSLSREGELVISYNINPIGFANNFNGPGTADNYRPYFVRIFNWK